MKIKILKDYEAGKAGEIKEAKFPAGDEQEYVDNGFIEIIEQKKNKPSKKTTEPEQQLTVEQIDEELYKAANMLPIQQDEFLEDLANKSGKRVKQLKKQLTIIKQSPKDILKEQSKEEELENYKEGEINWIDDEYYDDWKIIKAHTKKLWKNGNEYTGNLPKWFFLAHSKDEIRGRPQLIDSSQKRIPLVRCAIKKDKDEIELQSFYFFDEKFDKRHDGFQKDAFALDFRMYRVISEDDKEYYLMSREQLPNQVCTFKGMLVELDDFAEMSRSMKISSLSRIFFVRSYETSIKVLTPEQLVTYTKNRNITEAEWLDFLAYHEIGTSNRFPMEAEILRSSHLLSSKVDKIPQHLGIMGPAGTRKSMGYIETIAHKFSDTPHIVEGANSRIKGLTPSFAVKPANLGYLAKCERIGWVDELGKMVEAESNKHQANTKNILGELNVLLDNKVREVNSGNDNTCFVQANAKFIFVMNPISGMKTLGGHVGLIDPTTMSRIFWWVQDADEQDFVIGPDGVLKVPPTQSQAQHNTIISLGVGDINENDTVLGKCWGRIDNREEFLTLFDTCQSFLCPIDDARVAQLSSTITQLAREPMKGVWKPRAEHHVKLLIDGIIKHRCLFKDYDETFTPKDEDYDLAERILIRMVNSWDTDLSVRRDHLL